MKDNTLKQADTYASSAPVDPLLGCLVFLTKYYGKPFSEQALGHGLPMVNGRLQSGQLPRAAERGGLTAKLVRKPLESIADLLLPCIALLEDQRACVVLAFDREAKKIQVAWPEVNESAEWIDLDQLNQAATGELCYVRKRYRFDARAPELLTTLKGHWFWSTLKLSVPIYRDALIASLFISLFAVASPLFVMNVYDRVVPNQALETLWVLVAGMGIVILFDFAMKQMRAHLLDIAAKKSDLILSARLFEKLLNMRMESRPNSTGAFSRNIQEFDAIRDFIASTTMAALVDVPFSLVFLLIIFIVSGPLVGIPVVIIALMLAYGLWSKNRIRQQVDEASRFATQRNAHLIESVSGVESLKINRAENQFQQRWEELSANIANWNLNLRRLSTRVGNVNGFLLQLNTVAIVALGVYQIAEVEMSMGGLIAAVMLSGRALQPFAQVALLTTRYNQADAALSALNQLMEQPEERTDQYLHRAFIDGRIQFEQVSFCYPNAQSASLKNLSFSIEPGEKVAIIGRIGAGKTSVEKLLLGLYLPQQGAIRVDGVDIQQISPADLRQKVGCLPQDINLFFGSIRDNISLGVPHIDDERVLRAAKLAGVTEFTDLDPEGLDRQVGERGQFLSGGQRQAVALARALLFNPPVVVLDEPTSHMDNMAEAKIKQQLSTVLANKTVLLITHKLSLLDLVDRVIVLERGHKVADGPKAQVLQLLQEGKVRAPS